MFLNSLTVRSGEEAIRVVKFRLGLNLVVDETDPTDRTDSGNSVGKTTFLRSIDYCLGGDGKALYRDPEFKDVVNEDVLTFLRSGVSFTLDLVNDLTPEAEQQVERHVIVRKFEGAMSIDGEEYQPKAFNRRLAKILFGIESAAPTARQLLAKFIRVEPYEIANVLRFLHPATKNAQYDAIYLFLFGFHDRELLTRRTRLQTSLRNLVRQRSALNARSKSTLQQAIGILDRDIALSEQRFERFNVASDHKQRLVALSSVRGDVARLSLEQSKLDLRLRLAEQTMSDLSEADEAIDVGVLRELYAEATTLTESLAHDFEELVAFHRDMVANKIRFVRSTLRGIVLERDRLRRELDLALQREQELLRGLDDAGAFAELAALRKRLDSLYEERGRRTALLHELRTVDKEIAEKEEDLGQVEATIESFTAHLQAQVLEFNLIFSEYSQRLYGEQFLLALDIGEGKTFVQPRIQHIGGNEGTGKKRAAIAAFDLAYLQLLADEKSTIARFTMHDQLEVVASNQLATLFEIAESINGQYVVPILSDRLVTVPQHLTTHDDGGQAQELDQQIVLRLSQADKFFRV